MTLRDLIREINNDKALDYELVISGHRKENYTRKFTYAQQSLLDGTKQLRIELYEAGIEELLSNTDNKLYPKNQVAL